MSALLDADRFHLRRLCGEDSVTAFRRVRFGRDRILAPAPDALAADLVAFANGAGGSVFVGAESGRSFVGLGADRAARAERLVVEAGTCCHPPIHPRFDSVPLPERRGRQTRIVHARIPRGLFLHRTRDGDWYRRWGSRTRRLTPDELRRAQEERAQYRLFDHRPVGWATPDALDDERLRPELARRPVVPAREVLRRSGITGPDEEDPEVERPTVAGLLAFGENPADFLSAACVEASVFAGAAAAPGDPVHAETLTGALVDQCDAAVAFVARFAAPAAATPVREGAALGRVAVDALGREAVAGRVRGSAVAPVYPPEVVFEAVANAVAHRDYSLPDDPIRLSLFADRLEVVTPGGLPRPMTPEELPYGIRTRNECLANFLRRQRSRLLDRPVLRSRGEGVPRLRSRAGATHDLRDSALVLTLRPGLPVAHRPFRRFGPAGVFPAGVFHDRSGLRP